MGHSCQTLGKASNEDTVVENSAGGEPETYMHADTTNDFLTRQIHFFFRISKG